MNKGQKGGLISEFVNPEGITVKRFVAAQKSFWEFCKLMNPKFFRDDRAYQRELCDVLQGIFEGTLINPATKEPYRKIMINLPPRHGKSYIATLFTQWIMGRNKETRCITVSYNDILAGRFARTVRDGIDATKIDDRFTIFRDVFPSTRIKQGDASMQMWSLEGQYFSYLGAGFGGTITGVGCSIGIIDDPIKSDKEAFNTRILEEQWSWYGDTFLSRIEAEEGREGIQIAIMTRWSTQDLCGRLLASEDADEWFVFKRRACLDEAKQLMLCPSILSYKSYIKRRRNSIYMETQPRKETKALPKGIGWVRYQKCMGQAHGNPEHAAYIARKMYDDPGLIREIKALSVTNPTGGGFLVPEMYADEVIPLLYAQAVVTKLGATVVPMPNGNLRIPRLNSGSVASYTGELRPIKTTKPSFDQVVLNAKKLTAKIAISNDLLRSNSYKADSMILNDAVRQMALAMDKAALMGKGSEYEPLGLLNMKGVPRITLAAMPDEKTTGQLLAELIRNNADTAKLGWAFGANVLEAFYNITNQLGLYIYRPQMDEEKLNGHTFAISTQLTADDTANRKASLVLGNWAEFMIGEQLQMESEFFKEGSITDEEGRAISALDNDMTILRIISTHDFGVRHEKSFVIADEVHTK